jgi:hypothetical protein
MGRMPAIGLVLLSGMATLTGCADDRSNRYGGNTLPTGQPGQTMTASGQQSGQRGNAFSTDGRSTDGRYMVTGGGQATTGTGMQAGQPARSPQGTTYPQQFIGASASASGSFGSQGLPATSASIGASDAPVTEASYGVSASGGQPITATSSRSSSPASSSFRSRPGMTVDDVNSSIPTNPVNPVNPTPPVIPLDAYPPPTSGGRFEVAPSTGSSPSTMSIPPTTTPAPTPPYTTSPSGR